ncbi:MAG: AAA-like domain-containing protein [Pseudomonadota bacterium]
MSETSTVRGVTGGATTRSARPQFFSLRGPLAPDRPGYIERTADREVWNALERAHYVNLTGAPKSGKTSLLLRMSRRLRELDDPPAVALIELRQLLEREGRDDVARCFYAIAFRLARQLRVSFDLQDWWADNAMLPHHLRFVELFREFVAANPGRQLVLLFDDSGDLVRREEGEPFLQAIRLAYDSRTTDPDMARLSIVFGSTGDAQFGIGDSVRMPHAVSERVTLEPFNLGETLRLAPALGLSREIAEFAMQRIFDWAAGQPSMTQSLAASLASLSPSPSEVAAEVDKLAERMLAKPISLGSDDFVGVAAQRLLDAPRANREAMLVALGQISKLGRLLFDGRSPAHDQLLALGLAKLSPDGFMVPGSRIIRRQFGASWANRHLSIKLRGAAIAIAATVLFALFSTWYFNRLPAPAVRTLTSVDSTLPEISAAYERLTFWPGHAAEAERLLVHALSTRFNASAASGDIDAMLELAERYDVGDREQRRWISQLWRQRRVAALRQGNRLAALRAAQREMVVSPGNRALQSEAISLTGSDLPDVTRILDTGSSIDDLRFDAREDRLVSRHGSKIRFWPRDRAGTWMAESTEIEPASLRSVPLNLRFELPEIRRAAALTARLTIQHPRPTDLQLTLTAPNGVSATLPYEALPEGEWRLSDVEAFRVFRSATPAGIWSMTIVDTVPDMTGEVVVAQLGGEALGDAVDSALSDPAPSTAADVMLGPDGRFAVVFPDESGDLAASWELKTRRIVAALPVMSPADVIGFATNGTELIARLSGRVVRLRLSDGALLELPDRVATASNLWLSDNGLFLVSIPVDQSVLRITEIASGESTAQLTTSGSPERVAVSSDASLVAMVEQDRVVRVWSTQREQIVAQVPVDSGVVDLSFAGDQLLIVPADGGVLTWSVQWPDGPLRWEGEPVWSAAHDRQTGLTLLGSARDGFRIHDLVERTDRALPFLGLSGMELRADVMRLRDGLAVISEPETGLVAIWEPSLPALSVGGFKVRRAWLSESNTVLAIADARGSFTALRLDEDIEALRALDDTVAPVSHSTAPEIVRFSPDQQLVLSIERSGLFRLHDVEEVVTRRRIGRTPEPVHDAAFDARGDEFVIAAGNRLIRFRADTGRQVSSLALDAPASSIVWSPTLDAWLIGDQGGGLSSLSRDDQESLRPLNLLEREPIDRIASGLLGSRIAVARGRRLSTIDLTTRQSVGEVIELPSKIEGLVAAPDGRHLIVRAGQWIFRVHSNSVGLSIRSQRLIPAGALQHSALIPADDAGSFVTLLDGLDEPVPRTVSMDFSDVLVSSESLDQLERAQRALVIN